MGRDFILRGRPGDVLSEERWAAGMGVLEKYGARSTSRRGELVAGWGDGTGFRMYSESMFGEGGPFRAQLSTVGTLGQRFCEFLYEFALAVGCEVRLDAVPGLVVAVHPAVSGGEGAGREVEVVRASSGVAIWNALRERQLRGATAEVREGDRGAGWRGRRGGKRGRG